MSGEHRSNILLSASFKTGKDAPESRITVFPTRALLSFEAPSVSVTVFLEADALRKLADLCLSSALAIENSPKKEPAQ